MIVRGMEDGKEVREEKQGWAWRACGSRLEVGLIRGRLGLKGFLHRRSTCECRRAAEVRENICI